MNIALISKRYEQQQLTWLQPSAQIPRQCRHVDFTKGRQRAVSSRSSITVCVFNLR